MIPLSAVTNLYTLVYQNRRTLAVGRQCPDETLARSTGWQDKKNGWDRYAGSPCKPVGHQSRIR